MALKWLVIQAIIQLVLADPDPGVNINIKVNFNEGQGPMGPSGQDSPPAGELGPLYGCNNASGPWWTPDYCRTYMIIWSSNAGNASLTMDLIESGTDINLVNPVNRTALAVAAHWGRATLVDLLLKNGADTSVIDAWGTTALQVAEARKCEDPDYLVTGNRSCKLSENDYDRTISLLKAGEASDISSHLYGCNATSGPWWTPEYCVQWLLHWSATLGDIDLTKSLLETGRDINLQHNVKRTALHIAAHWGRASMVDFLLKNGAKTELKDMWGNKALDLAELRKCDNATYFETWKLSCTRAENDYPKTIVLLKAAIPKVVETIST